MNTQFDRKALQKEFNERFCHSLLNFVRENEVLRLETHLSSWKNLIHHADLGKALKVSAQGVQASDSTRRSDECFLVQSGACTMWTSPSEHQDLEQSPSCEKFPHPTKYHALESLGCDTCTEFISPSNGFDRSEGAGPETFSDPLGSLWSPRRVSVLFGCRRKALVSPRQGNTLAHAKSTIKPTSPCSWRWLCFRSQWTPDMRTAPRCCWTAAPLRTQRTTAASRLSCPPPTRVSPTFSRFSSV